MADPVLQTPLPAPTQGQPSSTPATPAMSPASAPALAPAPVLNSASADNAVVTTLNTALPGQPSAPTSLGTKEAPMLRSSESGAPTTEISPAQSSENEPSREKEMNLERLEAQIQEAKARGPKKVAVAAETMPTEEPKTVAQPVVILPLTEQKMDEARKKSPVYSVKWLWTWCRRQMKKFAEIIVMYREPPQK